MKHVKSSTKKCRPIHKSQKKNLEFFSGHDLWLLWSCQLIVCRYSAHRLSRWPSNVFTSRLYISWQYSLLSLAVSSVAYLKIDHPLKIVRSYFVCIQLKLLNIIPFILFVVGTSPQINYNHYAALGRRLIVVYTVRCILSFFPLPVLGFLDLNSLL